MPDIKNSEELNEEIPGKSEINLYNILNSLPDMVMEISRDFKVLWANKAALDLNPRAIGNACYNIITDNETVCENCVCPEVFETQEMKKGIIHRPETKKSAESYREMVCVPLKGEKETVSTVLVVSRDVTDKKNAEEKIRENERKMTSLFKAAPVGIGIVKNRIFQEVNNQFCEMIGYSSEDLIGKSSRLIYETDEEYEKVGEIKYQQIDAYGTGSVDTQFKCKDGKIIDVILSSTPIDPSDLSDGVTFTALDITDRKKAETALINSEKKWRNILINTPQIGIALNPEGKIVFANANFLKLTGWKEWEVMGQDWFDMFIPEDISSQMRNVFLSTMTQKDTVGFSTYENEIKDRSGKLMNIAWSNVLTKDAEENVIDVTCLGVDLTERKRSEDALRKSEAKYRTMMEAINDPVYISSKEMYIEYMNEAMIERAGKNAIGKKCYEALHGLEEKCPWCDFNLTFQKGVSEKDIVSPADNRAFNVSSSIFLNADGSLSKISILRDMTEFRALQDHLQQAQKMESIGTLAGGIAHDFNNILSPIMLHSEMAMDDIPPDDPVQFSIKEIYRAGERARDLVKQILTFARKKSDTKVVLKASLIVKEALKFLRSTIPTTIDIRYRAKSDHDTVFADPTQVNQIVMNLCANAAHAMKENGGVLEIILDNEEVPPEDTKKYINLKSGKYLKLSVKDTGTGIAPDVLSRIFEPYYTTKQQGEGTGLGLSIIHGIIRDCDGDIAVETEAGKGTAFHVYLPLISAEYDQGVSKKKEVLKGTESLLIVDDEKAAVDATQKLLERIGYKVTARTSSIEALEAFRNNPKGFDLVITDMTMPNMTGKELTKELMAIRKDIPVILCTGFSDSINYEEAKEIGISAFIMKPIVMSEMAVIIRDILD